jgi:Chlamydia-phage Chp2 scaffold (Chlamy_scaf)
MANRVKLICDDPSLAVQSQKDEADINNIVRNFGITGQLPSGANIPTYGDFEGVNDYRSAIEAVRAAELAFHQLPAALRLELENDPQRFLEYCVDPENLPKLRELGLALPLPPASDQKDVAGE